MNYYVFRIDYGDAYQQIRKELIAGRLRQGWGAPGMSVGSGSSLGTFSAAWDCAWPGEDALTSPCVARKYSNLRIMCEMQKDDLIVIPKVSLDKPDGWQYFTIVRCTGSYSFDPLGNDFGHIVPVEPIVSVPYAHAVGRTVKRGFRCYQSPINHVWKEEFIDAINLLCHDITSCKEEALSDIDALSTVTKDAKEQYLDALVKAINSWSPKQLEHIIEELFVQNGYEKIGSNTYNRTGGDIDLTFRTYPRDTLMGAISALSGDQMPEIRVQAKNKRGQDWNDHAGVLQLKEMPASEGSINILINTTAGFSEDAKALAGRDVILINGRQFAALLLKYGLDAVDEL